MEKMKRRKYGILIAIIVMIIGIIGINKIGKIDRKAQLVKIEKAYVNKVSASISEANIANNEKIGSYDKIEYEIRYKIDGEEKRNVEVKMSLTKEEARYASFEGIKKEKITSVLSEDRSEITINIEEVEPNKEQKLKVQLIVKGAPNGYKVSPKIEIKEETSKKYEKIEVKEAEVETRSVTGVVRDGTKNGVSNIEIKIEDNEGKEIKRTYTDAYGKYTFSDLEIGKYVLGIVEDRYEIISENEIEINASEVLDIEIKEVEPFNIKIKKYITKVTINGKTYTYGQLEKVNQSVKNLKQVEGEIEYKVVIKNEGKKEGVITRVEEEKAEGLSFKENNGWKEKNGKIRNEEVEGISLKAGEEKEIKLILQIDKTNEAKSYLSKVTTKGEIYEKVSYVLNGKIKKEEEVLEGEKINELKINGQSFSGWYTDKNYTNKYNFDNEVTKDIILYGKTEEEQEKYLVTYVGVNGEILSSKEYEKGSVVYAPEIKIATGYSFTGWLNKETNKYENDPITVIENVTLYAQEKINRYKVKFVNNDDSILEEKEYNYGEIPTYSAKEPIRVSTDLELKKNEYAFDGWDKNIEKVEKDTVYKAKYKVNKREYKVRYIDEEGNKLKEEETYYYEDEVKLTNPEERANYDFIGWYKNNEKQEDKIIVYENITLVGKYVKTNYIVRFIDKGKDALERVSYTYGEVITEVTPNTDDGEIFKEWNTMEDGTGEKITLPHTVEGNLTVYSIYEPKIYTVKFFDKETEIKEFEQKVQYEETAKEPELAPTLEDYKFIGWYIRGTNIPYVFGVPVTEDIELEAKFTEKDTYTVSFDIEGDITVLEPIVVKEDNNGIERPNPDPIKKGYTFDGWYIDNTYTTPYTFKNKITSNIVLYGRYIENTHKVTYINEDITYKETYVLDGFNALSTKPELDPVKEGYTFKYWTKDKEDNLEYPFIEEIHSDLVLYAVYEINGYDIRFEDYDGTELVTRKVNYGEIPKYSTKEDPLENPTRMSTDEYDYEFIGFTPEITEVTGDAVYIATYKEIKRSYRVTFVDEDDTTLQSSDVLYGELPVYEGENPIKEETDEYTYEFIGWTPEITTVTKEAIYKATYRNIKRSYLVTFIDDDGEVLQEGKLFEYGEMPVYEGATPTKEETDEYTYSFTGFTPEITEVTENKVYTAVYEKTKKGYIVTFIDGNSEEVETVQYGNTTPEKTPNTPEHNIFLGWYLEGEVFDFNTPIIQNITLVATYELVEKPVIDHETKNWTNPDIEGNEKVFVTIKNESHPEYKFKYKIDDGEYIDYTGAFEVSENCRVISKSIKEDLNGIEVESEIESHEITNIDKIAPTLEMTNEQTTTTITLNGTIEDNESGPNKVEVYYVKGEDIDIKEYLSDESKKDLVSIIEYTIEDKTNPKSNYSIEINELEPEEIYTVSVTGYDNVLNKSETIETNIRTNSRIIVAKVVSMGGKLNSKFIEEEISKREKELGEGNVSEEEINEIRENYKDIEFESLDEAIKYCTNAESTCSIEMVRDTQESVEILDFQNITLDFNGKNITSDKEQTILNNGNLTVIDKASIHGSIKNTKQVGIRNIGTLIVGDNNDLNEEGNISVSIEKPYIYGKTVGVLSSGTLDFYDGMIEGNVAIEGNVRNTPYLYNVRVEDTGNQVATLTILAEAEARINTSKYYTQLSSAVNETKNGKYEMVESTGTYLQAAQNMGDYGFIYDEGENALFSSNAGQLNTTSKAYIEIDLTNYEKSQQLTVDAEIYSEANNDIGYAVISESTEEVEYNETVGRLFYISGSVVSRKYTTILSAGKKYYLHVGYRKNGSVNTGVDALKINDISLTNINYSEGADVQSNTSYSMVQSITDNKIINNNQGVDNSTANSYIKIDTTDWTEEGTITVNAQISSETNFDIGYATITETEEIPAFDNTSGRFISISGEVGAKDYTATLETGKIYYLHLGYRKDTSNSRGTDTFTINSIKYENGESVYGLYSFEDTESNITNKVVTNSIPVLNSETDSVVMLRNITLTSPLSINETRNVVLDLNGNTLDTNINDYVIKNKGSLTITDNKYTSDIENTEINYRNEQAAYDEEYENTLSEYEKNGEFENLSSYDNLVTEANTLLCTLGGRAYYKTNDEPAFVAYYSDGGWTYPLLVGETPESVRYTTVGNTFNYASTYTYNEKTYYVSSTGYSMSNNYTSTSGVGIKLDSTSTIEAVKELLEKNMPSKTKENNMLTMSNQYASATTILAFRTYCNSDACPSSVEFLGSNDKENYDTILSETDLNIKEDTEYIEINVPREKYNAYKYYKWNYQGNEEVDVNEITTKNFDVQRKQAVKEEAVLQGNITSSTGSLIFNASNANLVLDTGIFNLNKQGTSSVLESGVTNYGTMAFNENSYININKDYNSAIYNYGTILDSDGYINVKGPEHTHGYAIVNNSSKENTFRNMNIYMNTNYPYYNVYAISQYGTKPLLIDNVTTNGTGRSLYSTGDVTLENINFTSSYESSVVAEKGTLNMNSGSIVTPSYAIYTPENGNGYGVDYVKINVNGGILEASGDAIYAQASGTTINFNNGLIKSNNSGIQLISRNNIKLNMTGGKIESNNDGIRSNYPTIEINGGSIYHKSGNAINIQNALANIGGTFETDENSSGYGIGVSSNSTANINGNVKIKGNYERGINNNGIVNILGDVSISAKGSGIYNNNTGTINIGTKDGIVNTEYPKIISDKYAINNSATVNYYDGMLIGEKENSITAFISDSEDNYDLLIREEDDTRENVTLSVPNLEEFGEIAKIGDTSYPSIQAAFNALDEEEKEVIIQKDIRTILASTLSNDEKEIKGVLDTNGHTIKSLLSLPLITNNEKLKVTNSLNEVDDDGLLLTDNGIIYGAGYAIENSGDLTLEKSTLSSGGTTVLNKENGKLTLNSGKIIPGDSSNTNIGIKNTSTNMVIMDGGEISWSSYFCSNVNAIASTAGEVEINNGSLISLNGGGCVRAYGIENGSNSKLTINNLKINSSSNNGAPRNISNAGEVIINDITSTTAELYNYENGTIDIYDGKITSSDTIENRSTGEFNIYGGNITSTGRWSYTIGNFKSGTVNIYEDATINHSNGYYNIYNKSNGVINIYGGVINSTASAIQNSQSGTVNVIGGTINSNINSGGTLNLGTKGDTKEDGSLNVSKESPLIVSNSTTINNSGTFNFYDGIIKGSTAINGSINETETGYEVILGEDPNYNEVKYLDRLPVVQVVGEDNPSYTIEDALVTNSCTLKQCTMNLLRDITLTTSAEPVIVSQNKNAILNLDGHTITSAGATFIENLGAFTITDSSAVTSDDSVTLGTGRIISNSSKLIINKGILNAELITISGNTGMVVENIGSLDEEGQIINGILNIEDSDISSIGTVITNSGYMKLVNSTISGDGYGMPATIQNIESGNIDINGGSIGGNGTYQDAIQNLGTGIITINDGARVTAPRNGDAIENNSTGSIIINSGEIVGNYNGIKNNSSGLIEVNNATIYATNYYSNPGIYNKEGTVRINGGTIKNIESNGGSIEIDEKDEEIPITIWADRHIALNLSGGVGIIKSGTLSGSNTVINNNANLTITGGIIEHTGGSNAIVNTGTITLGIKGDTKDDETLNVSKESPLITSVGTALSNSGTFNFYDGILKGNVAITGNTPAEVEDGYEVILDEEDGYKEVKYLDVSPVAEIYTKDGIKRSTQCKMVESDDACYNFQDALDSANNTDIIKVTRNVTIMPNTEPLLTNKNIVFDLNGYQILIGNSKFLENSGTLKVIDSKNELDDKGKITSGTGYLKSLSGVLIENSGMLDISGANLINTTGDVDVITNIENGEVIVNSGALSSSSSGSMCYSKTINNSGGTKITINGGLVSKASSCSNSYAVSTIYSSFGEINIAGGNITANGSIYAIYTENGVTTNISDSEISATHYLMRNGGEAIVSSGIYSGSITNAGEGSVLTISEENEKTTRIIGNIASDGELNITSGSITGTLSNSSTGTVNLSGGTLELKNMYGDGSLVYNTGILNMTGGMLETNKTAIHNNGTMDITGGAITGYTGILNDKISNISNATITSTNRSILQLSGTVNLSNITLENTPIGIELSGGIVNIPESASINASDKGIYITNSNGSVNIGTQDRVVSDSNPIISGGNYGLYNTSGKVYFYDGIIEGADGQATFGTITETESGYKTKTDPINIDGVARSRTTLSVVGTEERVAVVNGINFTSLQSAINAAVTSEDASTETLVTLYVDIELTENIIVPTGKNIKLYLNGFTITKNGYDFVTNGNGIVEIVDEAKAASLGGSIIQNIKEVLDIDKKVKNIVIYEMNDGSKLEADKTYKLYKNEKQEKMDEEESLGRYKTGTNEEEMKTVRGRLYLNGLTEGTYEVIGSDGKRASFNITEEGKIYGTAKENIVSENKKLVATAVAELIISIQTGVIKGRYVLLLSLVFVTLTLLVIIQRRKSSYYVNKL